MKKERLNYFQQKLVEEKKLLEEELSALGTMDAQGDWSAVPSAHNDIDGDDADQAEFVEDFDSKIGRLSSLELRYRQIIAAIDRIGNGTYGVCIKSGQAIEEDRLEANPAAETCKAMMNL